MCTSTWLMQVRYKQYTQRKPYHCCCLSFPFHPCLHAFGCCILLHAAAGASLLGWQAGPGSSSDLTMTRQFSHNAPC